MTHVGEIGNDQSETSAERIGCMMAKFAQEAFVSDALLR
jgi:hypothetical protein